ncbi:hypothetical protein [Azonexus fungiphilus]|uniref:hypothetical protein n=1 Tax=Azonexus fungiphilus TaxID=146940 RepID=UPI0011C36C55|nr:hypothetical protein [Azonexus fungiphilus]NHC06227.1 hypothetical protein [Azonexus fungiphilus]
MKIFRFCEALAIAGADRQMAFAASSACHPFKKGPAALAAPHYDRLFLLPVVPLVILRQPLPGCGGLTWKSLSWSR